MPDSDCIIAALCDWHEHCQQARREIDRRIDSREDLILAAPTLLQAYSVLTRLPRPYQLSADVAFRLLDANFMEPAREIIAVDGAGHRLLLQDAVTSSVLGGQVYDAVIARCARQGGVDAVLTFNERDFARLITPPIQVVVPA